MTALKGILSQALDNKNIKANIEYPDISRYFIDIVDPLFGLKIKAEQQSPPSGIFLQDAKSLNSQTPFIPDSQRKQWEASLSVHELVNEQVQPLIERFEKTNLGNKVKWFLNGLY